MMRRLLLGVLAETADGGSHGDRGGGVEGVRPARLGLLAAGALPDADSLALHGVLAAKVAEKLGVLGHLLLLHHLAEGSTVTGAVLADDPCEEEEGEGRRAGQRRGSWRVRHGRAMETREDPAPRGRTARGGVVRSRRWAPGDAIAGARRDRIDPPRSSRDRNDPPRRVRRYRAPALPARLVSRCPPRAFRRNHPGWNPKNPDGSGAHSGVGGGPSRDTHRLSWCA